MGNKKKKKFKVQTLIFEKKLFNSRKKVKNWILDNGFKLLKFKKQPVESKDKTFRVRQRDPGRFRKSTFITSIFIELNGVSRKLPKGVKAVKGKLR